MSSVLGMDVIWILAAVIILLTALGVAIWLVALARRMSDAVESAQHSALVLEGLAAAATAETPGKRRARPAADEDDEDDRDEMDRIYDPNNDPT